MKRAIPYDAEYPREHIDSTRDLMIVVENLNVDEKFLKDLRDYFSSYGILYACKYCHEENFNYIFVEFADFGKKTKTKTNFLLIHKNQCFSPIDQVDRIILDKPHYFNNQQLNVMKCLANNKTLMNIKYSLKENSSIIKDAIDVNENDKKLFTTTTTQSHKYISEIDLENEAYRLQKILKNLPEDFLIKRKQLEDDCCEQLKKLNENANQTDRLQQDLEQGLIFQVYS